MIFYKSVLLVYIKIDNRLIFLETGTQRAGAGMGPNLFLIFFEYFETIESIF